MWEINPFHFKIKCNNVWFCLFPLTHSCGWPTRSLAGKVIDLWEALCSFFFFLERISYNWVAFISIFRTIYDDRTCPGQEQTMCSWMLRVVCGICASCLALSCPAARPYKSGGAALGEAFFRKRAQVFPSAKLHIVSLASATCNHYSKLLRALHSWRWKLKSLVL